MIINERIDQNGVTKTIQRNPANINLNNNNNNNIPLKKSSTPILTRNAVSKAEVKLQPRPTVPKQDFVALLKQLKHASKGFESLAVLVNHRTEELELEKARRIGIKLGLDELQASYRRLEDNHQDRQQVIIDLESENDKLAEENTIFRQQVEEYENVFENEKKKLSEVTDELRVRSENEQKLRKETNKLLQEYSERVSALSEENDKLKSELCILREEKQKLIESNNELESEVKKVREECQTLEAARKVREETRTPVKTVDTRKVVAVDDSRTTIERKLESDVESFRQALELKTNEAKELRCQVMRLKQDADRVPSLVSTIASLEARKEILETQLSSHTETERELLKQKDSLQDELALRNAQNTRNLQKVEELEYKLVMYAEAMGQIAADKNIVLPANYCPSGSPNRFCRLQRSEVTPPMDYSRKDSETHTRSQMKGVVEKSDSVSYILQMTEDSSEIVSNIVKRSQSVRAANRCQTLPKKRRNKTVSLGYIETPKHRTRSLSVDDDDDEDPKGKWQDKIVKLDQSDFVNDSIELSTNGDNCEIIEITKNFDKAKCIDYDMTSSTSSDSSSSSGSHFDIESDLFSNVDQEAMDDGTEYKSLLPIYQDLDPEHSSIENDPNDISILKSVVKIPKISGGEAMISSDDVHIKK